MKKIFTALLLIFLSFTAYAQESTEDNTIYDNATSSNKEIKAGKKPDFNKKRISLDRLDERKWALNIGYNYFTPDDKNLKMFNHRISFGGSYEFFKFLQLQAFLEYTEGSDAYGETYDDSNKSIALQGALYNVGLAITGLLPFETSIGSFGPFISAGAMYSFGTLTSYDQAYYYDNETTVYDNDTQKISGGGIFGEVGLQYSYNVVSVRLYGKYTYDFTNIDTSRFSSFSGYSIGLELGVKF